MKTSAVFVRPAWRLLSVISRRTSGESGGTELETTSKRVSTIFLSVRWSHFPLKPLQITLDSKMSHYVMMIELSDPFTKPPVSQIVS